MNETLKQHTDESREEMRGNAPSEHVDRCNRCGETQKDIDVGFCLSEQGFYHECKGGGRGKYEKVPCYVYADYNTPKAPR